MTDDETTERLVHQNGIWIKISDIVVDPQRSRKEFDSSKLQELAESIQNLGLINPITVRRITPKGEKNEKFLLLAGERRLRAIRDILHQEEIRSTIRESLDDPSLQLIEDAEVELEENARRTDLTWMESCQNLEKIDTAKRKVYGDGGLDPYNPNKWTVKKTAMLVGETRQGVGAKIAFARTLQERPDLAEKVEKLPMATAMKVVKKRLEQERLNQLALEGKIEWDGFLQLGDSREALKMIPSETVGMILTDPPFGIEAIENDREKGRAFKDQVYKGIIGDSDNMGLAESLDLIRGVIPDLFRVLKPGGHIYLFCSIDQVNSIRESLAESGFLVEKGILIWDKLRTTTAFMGYSYMSSFEPIIFAHKPPRERRLLKESRDILAFKPIHASQKIHPFEKPQELLRFLVDQSSLIGEIVLDPFAGSGSTVLAARTMKRIGWGFELDESNWSMGQKRLLGGGK